uniref:Transthyretin-like family protein n=2 Tax=Parascaris univalens TaxID=6257 RepID=A0A915CFJ9_PARUN
MMIYGEIVYKSCIWRNEEWTRFHSRTLVYSSLMISKWSKSSIIADRSMSASLLNVSLILHCLFFTISGREQSVGISGYLSCHGAPAIGVNVVLWDYDFIFTDDLMGMTTTNTRGSFTLAGSTDEFSTIEPHLAIYRKCWGERVCFPDMVVEIPDSVITDGKVPWKYYYLEREICDVGDGK